MHKFIRYSTTILHSQKYTFIPPSCYDISTKPNPIVSISLGSDEGSYCHLNLRVNQFIFSAL